MYCANLGNNLIGFDGYLNVNEGNWNTQTL